MKKYSVGDQIVLEVKESFNCVDCFFYETPIFECCYRMCGDESNIVFYRKKTSECTN